MLLWGTRLSTISNRQTKQQPEQLVAKLLDALASECRQRPGRGADRPGDQRGHAALLANREPPRSGGRVEMKGEGTEWLCGPR